MNNYYEDIKNKIRYIYNKTNRNENDIDKLKNYNIITKTINYNSKISRYYIFENFDFSSTGFFVINLENFPEEILSSLRLIPIYRIQSAYENFLTSIEYSILEEQGALPIEYYILSQECNWFFEKKEESGIIKFYVQGYFSGGLMNQDFDFFPILGDLYIFAKSEGDMK